jgi:hypothetical protein
LEFGGGGLYLFLWWVLDTLIKGKDGTILFILEIKLPINF